MVTPTMATERKGNGDKRRYRKIFTRLWRNPEFQALSSDDKLMTLYVLSGPQTNRIGLFLFSPGTASEDLGMPTKTVQKRLASVCRAFAWEFDSRTRVIWIPSWWTYNDPKDNVKAFQGALSDLNDVPRTCLLQKFCRNLVGVPEALHSLFAPLWEAIGDRSGIERVSPSDQIPARSQEQEQEQEQEKEQEQETDGRVLLAAWNDTVIDLPKAQAFTADRLKHARARLGEEPSLAWWVDTFRRMEASDFLSGRKPSRDHHNWRADIDFALKPGIAGKVREGKYDNRAALAATGTEGRGRTGVTRGQFEGVEEQD